MPKDQKLLLPPRAPLPMTYFIKTFGCQMNVSDSERIAGFLELQKMKTAGKIDLANLVVFNTCGIRQTAENSAMGIIHNLREKNPKVFIILTGCLAKRKDVQKKMKDKVDLFLPIQDFFAIENWEIQNLFKIQNLPAGRQGSKFKISAQRLKIKRKGYYLTSMPIYNNKEKALVPIMAGCNNFCSYCVVPYARGEEFSRPTEEIFSEIENLSQNGCQEITLLGQNVNSYFYKSSSCLSFPRRRESIRQPKLDSRLRGNDKIISTDHIRFPALLKKLAQSFPQITFKFLTSHPKDFSDELIQIIAENPNVSKEIHLPLQSGSDKILKAMNRPYTQKHYLTLIEKARQKIPHVRFTTDVIVGFPGETKKDLEETAKVLKKVKYNLVFINKFSPRPGTAAFLLKDSVSWDEKKRREVYLKKILKK